MAILKLLIEPDPRLRKKSVPVETIDVQTLTLLDDMYETMLVENGVGLAAPQVNVHRRIVVMQTEADGPVYEMINPEILWACDIKEKKIKEGCLSVPFYAAYIERPTEVDVRFLDRHGKEQAQRFSGVGSVCVLHEIDHLDGVLFIDYLSEFERNKVHKMLRKK